MDLHIIFIYKKINLYKIFFIHYSIFNSFNLNFSLFNYPNIMILEKFIKHINKSISTNLFNSQYIKINNNSNYVKSRCIFCFISPICPITPYCPSDQIIIANKSIKSIKSTKSTKSNKSNKSIE